MSRSMLFLIVGVVIVVGVLFGLASLDREVPRTTIEQPVTNAVTR